MNKLSGPQNLNTIGIYMDKFTNTIQKEFIFITYSKIENKSFQLHPLCNIFKFSSKRTQNYTLETIRNAQSLRLNGTRDLQ